MPLLTARQPDVRAPDGAQLVNDAYKVISQELAARTTLAQLQAQQLQQQYVNQAAGRMEIAKNFQDKYAADRQARQDDLNNRIQLAQDAREERKLSMLEQMAPLERTRIALGNVGLGQANDYGAATMGDRVKRPGLENRQTEAQIKGSEAQTEGVVDNNRLARRTEESKVERAELENKATEAGIMQTDARTNSILVGTDLDNQRLQQENIINSAKNPVIKAEAETRLKELDDAKRAENALAAARDFTDLQKWLTGDGFTKMGGSVANKVASARQRAIDLGVTGKDLEQFTWAAEQKASENAALNGPDAGLVTPGSKIDKTMVYSGSTWSRDARGNLYYLSDMSLEEINNLRSAAGLKEDMTPAQYAGLPRRAQTPAQKIAALKLNHGDAENMAKGYEREGKAYFDSAAKQEDEKEAEKQRELGREAFENARLVRNQVVSGVLSNSVRKMPSSQRDDIMSAITGVPRSEFQPTHKFNPSPGFGVMR